MSDHTQDSPITEMVAMFGKRMHAKESTARDEPKKSNVVVSITEMSNQTLLKETSNLPKRNEQWDSSSEAAESTSPSAAELPVSSRSATQAKAMDLSKIPSFKRKSSISSFKAPPKREKRRAVGEGSTLTTLNRLCDLVEACICANLDEAEDAHDALRDHIHKLEHQELSIHSIKGSKILKQDGLKRCFTSEEHNFPNDIKVDAKVLYKKWVQGDTNVDILRGIDYEKKTGLSGNERSTRKLNGEADFIRKTHAFYGNGEYLVNGMWWPVQLAALRDGAHGAMVAGISGDVKKGAYSVIMSGSDYEDVDLGDEVGYTGTKSLAKVPTSDTKCMKASLQVGNPVRLLRTCKLPLDNVYRPEKGIRYDGLYKVVDQECLDAETHHWRFLLRRIPGQDEIRYQGKAKRPTKQDLDAWEKRQELLGIVS